MLNEVIVVLGMARSGTSAITRGLKALGVELGNEFLPSNPSYNPKGFWENEQLLDINIQVLKSFGMDWDSLSLISPSRWDEPAIKDLQLKAIEIINRVFGESPIWGFKDPRTLRVLPFWNEIFNRIHLSPKYLIALRNPLSVAQSSLIKERGIVPEKCYLLWLLNVVPYLREIKNQPFIVVDYDLLMTNPIFQLQRIVTKLGISRNISNRADIDEYANEFLTNSLRHSQFSEYGLNNDPDVPDVAKIAYHWLRVLAQDEEGCDSEEFWKEWLCLESALVSFSPCFRYIDKCEQNVLGLHSALARREQSINGLEGELAKREQSIDGLKDELAKREQSIDGLKDELAKREQSIDRLKDALAKRGQTIDGLKGELARKCTESQRLRQELSEAVHKALGLEQRIAVLYASTSWVVTAPLRMVKNSAILLGKTIFMLLRTTLKK